MLIQIRRGVVEVSADNDAADRYGIVLSYPDDDRSSMILRGGVEYFYRCQAGWGSVAIGVEPC